MNNVFEKSQLLCERAKNSIPLASQTFSKSYLQYPQGCSLCFLDKGMRGRVWDVDGNEYVDLIAGLMPALLGYQDEDVDQAIKNQLEKSIVFSLPCELEVELAEKLVEIIPCAEMVRFGKNGSDVTSAAVRLARAYTKRDRIAVCGYHGWQDWYIGSTTRNMGVPEAVCNLTHTFQYNDLDSLHQLFRQHPGEFAAVIMEPMNIAEPYEGFLQEVKSLTNQAGALFILDEMITGFRFALGGAQEYFGVVPDLACFGKAMGNGMPISAIVGRADVMSLMEEIFFSGTFLGESLSLAASLAVINKLQREPVIETLWKKGKFLADAVISEIIQFGLEEVFSLSGKAPWMILSVNDYKDISKHAIRTLFMQEMIKHGVLIMVSHNVIYSHTDADLRQVVEAYKKTFAVIKEAITSDSVDKMLSCPVIEPIFKVR